MFNFISSSYESGPRDTPGLLISKEGCYTFLEKCICKKKIRMRTLDPPQEMGSLLPFFRRELDTAP
jgi:hypothetical protein